MAATPPPRWRGRSAATCCIGPASSTTVCTLSAERAALPHDVIIGLIKLFSWDVDFQRDVRRGDQFETLFEVVSLEDGSDRHPWRRSGVRGAVDRRPPARRLPLRAARRPGRLLRPFRQEPAQVPAAHPDRRRAAVVRLRHAPAPDPRLYPDAQRRRFRRADAARPSTPPARARSRSPSATAGMASTSGSGTPASTARRMPICPGSPKASRPAGASVRGR